MLCDRDRGWCVRGHVILYPSRKTSVHVRATLPIPWRAQTSFVVWTSAKAKENSTVGGIELPSTQPTIRRTTLSTKNSHSNHRAAENELLFSNLRCTSAFRKDPISTEDSTLTAWRAGAQSRCRCPTAAPCTAARSSARCLRVSRANPAVLPPQTAPFPLPYRRRERDDVTTRCVSCDPTR